MQGNGTLSILGGVLGKEACAFCLALLDFAANGRNARSLSGNHPGTPQTPP
jgi:hypothetical protein